MSLNHPRLRTAVLSAAIAALGLAVMPTATFAATPRGGGISSSPGKSSLVQDPAWVQLKESGHVVRNAHGGVTVVPATTQLVAPAFTFPSYYYMDTTVTGRVIEPEGRYYDDLHRSESDQNLWRFCAAGASAVTISAWLGSGFLTSGGINSYTEPYGPYRLTTYWGPTDTGTSADTSDGYSSVGRSAVMYVAEQSKPPTFGTPGVVDFTYYPTHGASVADVRDVLNWEISGHSSGWQTYFYAKVSTSGLAQATLLSDVMIDIAEWPVPVVVALNTYVSASVHLPNWSYNAAHAIAIVGYNNNNGTYRYVDTCGAQCGGGTNGGVHDVSQSTMYQLIMSLGATYGGYVW
jgi:hypothetical protein